MKKSLPLITTFIIGAGIGTVSTYLVLRSSNPQAIHRMTSSDQFPAPNSMGHVFDKAFDNNVFDQSTNPFYDMKEMRERMRKLFDDSDFDNGFNDWYGNRFGGKLGDIKSYEDEHFVFFEIDLKDIDQESLKFEVQNEQITVQGTQHRKDGNSSVSSSFMRSFPLPPGLNQATVTSEVKEGKLLIKFPKVTGETI